MKCSAFLTGVCCLVCHAAYAVTSGEAVESAMSVPPVDMDAILQESAAEQLFKDELANLMAAAKRLKNES